MGSSSCFVYGTLMFNEVLQALIDRIPKSQPAAVHGFKRFKIRGQVFPGTIASTTDSSVEGLVLFDLTPLELEVFDEFEGDEYEKTTCKPVAVGSDGASIDKIECCSIYLWRDDLRPLLYGDWDAEAFREAHLQKYEKMCRQFAEELRQNRKPDSRPLGFQ